MTLSASELFAAREVFDRFDAVLKTLEKVLGFFPPVNAAGRAAFAIGRIETLRSNLDKLESEVAAAKAARGVLAGDNMNGPPGDIEFREFWKEILSRCFTVTFFLSERPESADGPIGTIGALRDALQHDTTKGRAIALSSSDLRQRISMSSQSCSDLLARLSEHPIMAEELSQSLEEPVSHIAAETVGRKGNKGENRKVAIGPLEHALGLLATHSDWTDRQIAEAVGVNRTTLYKPAWLTYRKAREALKGAIPKGSKAKDGTVEAVYDE